MRAGSSSYNDSDRGIGETVRTATRCFPKVCIRFPFILFYKICVFAVVSFILSKKKQLSFYPELNAKPFICIFYQGTEYIFPFFSFFSFRGLQISLPTAFEEVWYIFNIFSFLLLFLLSKNNLIFFSSNREILL